MMSGSGSQLHISTAIPFEFEAVAPPTELMELVHTFFVVTTRKGRIDEVLPAYSAQFTVYVTGNGTLNPPDSRVYFSETVTLTAPLMSAMPITISGPAQIVGASLTPLGWHCLSGAPADEVNNCTVPATRVLNRGEIDRIEELAHSLSVGSGTREALFAAIGDTLKARRGLLNPDHVRFVNMVSGWLGKSLNPSLDDLYQELAMSQRTAQRLCRRYFGVSPSRLAKRFRAIRAAMLLANPDLSDAMRNEILATYFDQAHLIRDIRRYTGRTPGALQDESFIQDTLDPDAHGTPARLLR